MELVEFFERLSATCDSFKWSLESDGAIRGIRISPDAFDLRPWCPVAAVGFNSGSSCNSTGAYIANNETLHISSIDDVVAAADNCVFTTANYPLGIKRGVIRAKMLAAVGLEEVAK